MAHSDHLVDEVWKEVPGYRTENTALEASNLGRVRKLFYYKPSVKPNGYVMAATGHGRPVHNHRLVALAFLGEPPGSDYEVDHIDRNKANNNVDNLRWVSRKANKLRGDAHPNTKITVEQRQEIERLHVAGLSHRKLALRFGVVHSVIGRILRLERGAFRPLGGR